MVKHSDREIIWQLLVILLGAPLFQAVVFLLSGVSFETHYRYAFLSGMVMEYIFLALVIWFLRKNGRSLANIGLKRPERWSREILIGLGLGVALFVLMGILNWILSLVFPSLETTAQRPVWAGWVYGFALITAFAPIEEIIWRGYALTLLREHLKSTFVIVTIASVAFGLIHWWGGFGLVVSTVIVGYIYSGLFLWRRNLVANIVAHFVSDFPLFLFMVLQITPPAK